MAAQGPTKEEVEAWFKEKAAGGNINMTELAAILDMQGYTEAEKVAIAAAAELTEETTLSLEQFIEFMMGLAVINHKAARIRRRIRRAIKKRGGKLTPEEVCQVGQVADPEWNEEIANKVLEGMPKEDGKVDVEAFVKIYGETVAPPEA